MSLQGETNTIFRLHRSTIWFLIAAVILTIAASLVGIADNLPGIALLYSAGLALVLAVSHRWKRPDRFGFLFLAAVVGFFVMVVVHNFAEVGADRLSHLPALALLLSAFSVVGFITAVIICPVAGVVGVLGFVTKLDKKRAE